MRKLLALWWLAGPCAFAQEVTITKVELAGRNIVVHYDLRDANPSNTYQLKLYSSRDNFMSPLTGVTGDVGDEVHSGSSRKMEWAIADEFGPYKGKLALEIRGRVFVPFVKVIDFGNGQSFKRGKSYNLQLKAGSSSPIHVELFKGNQRIDGDMNHPNSGSYLLSIPANAKTGNDYRLKITDSRSNDEVVYTPMFSVKPKVPLVVKVLPVVAVGAVVVLLGGGSKNEPSGSTTAAIVLPPFPGN